MMADVSHLYLHPRHRRPVADTDGPPPAERLLRSHWLVEQAARELHAGDKGSGIRALSFAAATQLATTIGPEKAGAFFDMIANVARQVRTESDPAA